MVYSNTFLSEGAGCYCECVDAYFLSYHIFKNNILCDTEIMGKNVFINQKFIEIIVVVFHLLNIHAILTSVTSATATVTKVKVADGAGPLTTHVHCKNLFC